MNVQRHLGLLLVVLQTVAIGYFFQTPVFSVVMVVAALVGALSSIRIATPYAARRWVIALAVLYAVQRAVVPPAWYAGASSFLFPESCLIAEYFLVFQVGQFFVRRDGDRLPAYLPMLAIVVMTFTADVRVDPQERLVYQVFTAGLVALTAAFFAACRRYQPPSHLDRPRRRQLLLGIILLASISVGWAAASNLYRHARRIETMLGRIVRSSYQPAAGYSGQGRLGSVARQKERSGGRVALRVFAQDSPGYLRGKAFDSYLRGQWQDQSRQITITPADDHSMPPGSSRPAQIFFLSASDVRSWDKLEISPNQAFRKVLFLPPHLAALQVPVERVSVNTHGIVESDELAPGSSYTVWTTPSPIVTSPENDAGKMADAIGMDQEHGQTFQEDWQRLTHLPDDLDPRVRDLAMRIMDQEASTRGKIAAVEQYFLDNYQYQFGIEVPEQTDPLTYFLLEKPPAHCESFASGATIVLRAGGVPCRYVTGFVVAEKNNYGDYWIARNRDAHAWAEAYDPERGWVLVEATPAGGVPQQTTASTASQMWDAMRTSWQRLLAFVRQGGLTALLKACGRLLIHPVSAALLLIAAAALAVWRLRRWRRKARPTPQDPWVKQLQRLLQQMDGRWRKAGLMRAPHETLHQFARRVESAASDPAHHEAAAWYRQFAAVRYGGQTQADTVRLLQDALMAADRSRSGGPHPASPESCPD